MITELERRLTEAFHEDAQRARMANPEHPAESRATLGAPVTAVPTLPLTEPSRGRRRWPTYVAAAVAVAACVAALTLLPASQDDPVEPATVPESTAIAPVAGPFVGVWLSTDSDGSAQTMVIRQSSTDEYDVEIHDVAATGACSGAPATITGVGRVGTGSTLVIAQAALTCDDGATPALGPSPQTELANFTFERDTEADELVDVFGVVWRREGSVGQGDTPSSAATSVVPPDASSNALGAPTAAQVEVVRRLVEAIDAAAADDALRAESLPDVFTDDAVVTPFEGSGASPGSLLDRLDAWIAHLRAWGYEADLGECWVDSGVVCTVRGSWTSLLAEADEWWNVDFVGDRVQALTIVRSGKRFGEPVLPLSVAELQEWEAWLQQTDPETAGRLLRGDPTVQPYPAVPRYDPNLADEITASISLYLTLRSPGDEITVTPDLIEFGDRLVGLIGNMDRADGRTYVIAGRYQTEADLLFSPESAVLAAFDDAGTELWRTELDGRPVSVVAVADDLWVLHSATEMLSRFNASDGRVLGQVSVEGASEIVGAFGSAWVMSGESPENVRMIRVDPDLSTTVVELPRRLVDMDDIPDGAAAGPDAVWVPLGDAGVAVIDPDTLIVTVISGDELGHGVHEVGFDDEAAYVASDDQVTSIVDGEVGATASAGEISYLGHLDGVFGMLQSDMRFTVLRATDPMVVDVRRASGSGASREIDGEAWAEAGPRYNLRRAELLPAPEA